MGFTEWPADLTDDGAALAREYAGAHGDIVSVMFIGGIPWPEALDGKPFSKAVQENLSYRTPAGKKLFLSISPLRIGAIWRLIGVRVKISRYPRHG
jgi:hypothetical protein